MRILATFYLAIALANFVFWLSVDSGQAMFPTAFSYLTWGLYFLTLLSLLAYSIGKLILPQTQWQVIFLVYVMVRLYELLTRGLVFTGGDLGADINIISTYLWLVVPPGLAMWHLGFRFAAHQPAPSKHNPHSLIAQHR